MAVIIRTRSHTATQPHSSTTHSTECIEGNTENDIWFIMKFLFTLLKCISTSHQCNAIVKSFLPWFFFLPLTATHFGVRLHFSFEQFFFLFGSAVLFQLQIIYMGVHCVSYQNKRYSYVQWLAGVCFRTGPAIWLWWKKWCWKIHAKIRRRVFCSHSWWKKNSDPTSSSILKETSIFDGVFFCLRCCYSFSRLTLTFSARTPQ